MPLKLIKNIQASICALIFHFPNFFSDKPALLFLVTNSINVVTTHSILFDRPSGMFHYTTVLSKRLVQYVFWMATIPYSVHDSVLTRVGCFHINILVIIIPEVHDVVVM